jgi:hypothetical protein
VAILKEAAAAVRHWAEAEEPLHSGEGGAVMQKSARQLAQGHRLLGLLAHHSIADT